MTWVEGSTTYYGFLTAAHDNNVNDVWKSGSTTIGTERKRQMSGSVDIALIARASSSINSTYAFAVHPWTYTAPAATYVNGTFPVGTIATTYGATTGSSTGVINTVSLTVSYLGVTFTNMAPLELHRLPFIILSILLFGLPNFRG